MATTVQQIDNNMSKLSDKNMLSILNDIKSGAMDFFQFKKRDDKRLTELNQEQNKYLETQIKEKRRQDKILDQRKQENRKQIGSDFKFDKQIKEEFEKVGRELKDVIDNIKEGNLDALSEISKFVKDKRIETEKSTLDSFKKSSLFFAEGRENLAEQTKTLVSGKFLEKAGAGLQKLGLKKFGLGVESMGRIKLAELEKEKEEVEFGSKRFIETVTGKDTERFKNVIEKTAKEEKGKGSRVVKSSLKSVGEKLDQENYTPSTTIGKIVEKLLNNKSDKGIVSKSEGSVDQAQFAEQTQEKAVEEKNQENQENLVNSITTLNNTFSTKIDSLGTTFGKITDKIGTGMGMGVGGKLFGGAMMAKFAAVAAVAVGGFMIGNAIYEKFLKGPMDDYFKAQQEQFENNIKAEIKGSQTTQKKAAKELGVKVEKGASGFILPFEDTEKGKPLSGKQKEFVRIRQDQANLENVLNRLVKSGVINKEERDGYVKEFNTNGYDLDGVFKSMEKDAEGFYWNSNKKAVKEALSSARELQQQSSVLREERAVGKPQSSTPGEVVKNINSPKKVNNIDQKADNNTEKDQSNLAIARGLQEQNALQREQIKQLDKLNNKKQVKVSYQISNTKEKTILQGI